GAQIAAALISLTCTVDDGNDYNGIYLQSGQVDVSNLTCYKHGSRCASQVTTDTLAHAYGDTTHGADSTQDSDCGYFSNVEDVISSKRDFRYYCRRNTSVQEFAYRFNEYNPDDFQKAYPSFTNRTITASSGECNEYPRMSDDHQKTTIGDPKGLNYISAVKITFPKGSSKETISIPTSALGREGTTYIYRDSHTPAEAVTFGYGDRGIRMWAYRNPGETDRYGTFFECPITVSVVRNVHNVDHNITNGVARQAAASIALQGQWKGALNNPDNRQWQWYAFG
ncbi:MAG: hypothetical protein Q9179_002523, partial [Wetmoreana sp. 5 TL-2023]